MIRNRGTAAGETGARARIAVVIPCYRVRNLVLSVIERIPAAVTSIHVVDDCCPEQSGLHVQAHCTDPRVRLIFHRDNTGVGGATISGYRDALSAGAGIVVKIDGDGQMDPADLDRFVRPISLGQADYVKGNRFVDVELLRAMPRARLVGNSILSLVNKLASGYWHTADPTNGYTAIHADVLRLLPLAKLDQRFFFECDMLFRLNVVRAVVADIPLEARYGNEVSNLSTTRASVEFPGKYLTRFFKRVVYSYFLRDFNPGTLALVSGTLLTLAGSVLGAWQWYLSSIAGRISTGGEVMLSALPMLVGCQLLIAALNFDVGSVPRVPLHPMLASKR